MEDKQKDITEFPLSNCEVYKVLNARGKDLQNAKIVEILTYLESIKSDNKYPLEILRNLENMEADINTLAIVSNTSDISILSNNDKKRVIKACNISN